MSTVVVRYQTKPERADENQKLVEQVFEELRRQAPVGLRYATFRLDDGVSFVHIAAVDTADGSNPLAALPAFAEFTAGIADRCVEPPAARDATLVGSYRLYSD
jgi:hypothetical protein